MESSGRIRLSDEVIRYERANGSWELPLQRVRVIGEATTDHGPFADDYWLCFATHEGWYGASFYSGGRDEFLKALSDRLGFSIELELLASTGFTSRVVWPAALVNKPMFVYADKWPSNRLLRFAEKLLGGPFRNVQTYSPDVRQYLHDEDPP